PCPSRCRPGSRRARPPRPLSCATAAAWLPQPTRTVAGPSLRLKPSRKTLSCSWMSAGSALPGLARARPAQAERGFDELLLLRVVLVVVADGGRGRSRSAGVGQLLRRLERGQDVVLHEEP